MSYKVCYNDLSLPNLETCEAIEKLLPIQYEQRKCYDEYYVTSDETPIEELPQLADLIELSKEQDLDIEIRYDTLHVKG